MFSRLQVGGESLGTLWTTACGATASAGEPEAEGKVVAAGEVVGEVAR